MQKCRYLYAAVARFADAAKASSQAAVFLLGHGLAIRRSVSCQPYQLLAVLEKLCIIAKPDTLFFYSVKSVVLSTHTGIHMQVWMLKLAVRVECIFISIV